MFEWDATIPLLVSLFLDGSVSNEYGRIGVRVHTATGAINKVYSHSPAHDVGLRRGDVILEADGEKGYKHTDGMAGTRVLLKIKRGEFILYFEVPRVPRREVFEQKPQKEWPGEIIEVRMAGSRQER